MSSDAPKVSIGVPVYNGEKFVRATLDSILAQTFTDFEIVICDNCSTDSTPQICREYEAKDPRVRYHRNERNLGPAPNYNRCFELARGQYFKWSAADDTIAPTFLARCVEELDNDPSLSGVYAAAREIDESGKELYDHDFEVDLGSASPVVRLWKYCFCDHRKNHATEFWGLYRSDVLHQWRPTKGSFPSADRLVVTRCALRGRMPLLPDRLFFNRSHGNRSQTYLDKFKVRPGSRLVKYIGCGPLPSYEWWDATKKGKIVFPEWRWWWEYVRAVTDAPLPLPTKLACWGVTACLFAKFSPRLARDLIIATEQLVNRTLRISPHPPGPTIPKTAGG
jgi:glycosyltransferase involved in cell wall biosynthesis